MNQMKERVQICIFLTNLSDFPLFFLPQQRRCSKSSNQPRFLHFESLTLDSDELCEKWTCQVLPFWTTRNFLHLGESKSMVRDCLGEKRETGYVGSKIKKICWTQENSEKWIISWISSKVFEAQHQLGNTSQGIQPSGWASQIFGWAEDLMVLVMESETIFCWSEKTLKHLGWIFQQKYESQFGSSAKAYITWHLRAVWSPTLIFLMGRVGLCALFQHDTDHTYGRECHRFGRERHWVKILQ